MKISVDIKVDMATPVVQIITDDFYQAIATEWKKLIDPYTPRNTGQLEDSAVVKNGNIIYDPVDPETGKHYARDVYYPMAGITIHRLPEKPTAPPWSGSTRHERNPYSSTKWDEVAVQSGKLTELYRIINNQLLK